MYIGCPSRPFSCRSVDLNIFVTDVFDSVGNKELKFMEMSV